MCNICVIAMCICVINGRDSITLSLIVLLPNNLWAFSQRSGNITLFTFTAKPQACFDFHYYTQLWNCLTLFFNFTGLLCQSTETQQCRPTPSTEECSGSIWVSLVVINLSSLDFSVEIWSMPYYFLLYVLLEVIWDDVNIASGFNDHIENNVASFLWSFINPKPNFTVRCRRFESCGMVVVPTVSGSVGSLCFWGLHIYCSTMWLIWLYLVTLIWFSKQCDV